MRQILTTIIASLSCRAALAVDAAECRKGIRCGNSCIAANRTCHVGAPAPVQPSTATSAPSPRGTAPAGSREDPSAAALATRARLAAEAQADPRGQLRADKPPPAAATVAGNQPSAAELATRARLSAAAADPGLLIASEADKIYFRSDCSAAADIAPENRRWFPHEDAAQTAGFRRSSVPGC